MTEHITGRQARKLLDGTTPGPWEAGPSMTLSTTVAVFSHGYGPVAFISNREGGVDEVPALTDGALAAAAPELAETVAWLYGRKHSYSPSDMTVTWVVGDRIEVDACLEPGEKVQLSSPEMGGEWLTMHADEAVDLARALLAAAEEARDGVDR